MPLASDGQINGSIMLPMLCLPFCPKGLRVAGCGGGCVLRCHRNALLLSYVHCRQWVGSLDELVVGRWADFQRASACLGSLNLI